MRRTLLTLSLVVTVLSIDAQVPYLQWAKSLGGVSTQETVFSNSIAIDKNGNVYTAGIIKNGTADLDPGTGTYNLDFPLNGSMFISKLDAAGNFVWAKQFGNGAVANSYPVVAISVDKSGNVYATGGFQGTGDFDPGVAVVNLTSAGDEDIFILKLDTNGNFVWARRIGGTDSDAGSSIAVDANGSVYTTGWYDMEVDFDPGAGVYNLPANGCPTCIHFGAYVLKLDTDGNFVWAKQLGAGIGDAIGKAITIDASGNVYTTGDFSWLTADFDPGPGTFTLGDASPHHKTFISKLDKNGNFVWASGLYAIGYNDYSPTPTSIKADGLGNVITAGYYTYRTDFDPGIDSFNLSPSLSRDMYVSKLDASGKFVWAKSVGSTSSDGITAMALDAAGNVYAIGEFYGTVDFDPGPGTYPITSRPSRIDIFMLKLEASGDFAWVTDIAPTSDPYNSGQQSIATDESGNIYAAGFYFGTTDFDPGTGEYNLVPSGASDIFVLKFGQSFTGISENKTISDISIFPNPAATEINILFSKMQKDIVVKLIDNSGKAIQTTNFSGNQLVIKKGEIPNGIYFVQITDGINPIETRKIIFH